MTNKDILILALILTLALFVAAGAKSMLDNARKDGIITEINTQLAALDKAEKPVIAAEVKADKDRAETDKLAAKADAEAATQRAQDQRKLDALNHQLAERDQQIAALQSQAPAKPPETLAECMGELVRITDIAHLQGEELLIWRAKEGIWEQEKDALMTQLAHRTTQLAACDLQVQTKNARIEIVDTRAVLLERKADVALGKRRWFEAIVPRPQITVGLCAGLDGRMQPCVAGGVGWRF